MSSGTSTPPPPIQPAVGCWRSPRNGECSTGPCRLESSPVGPHAPGALGFGLTFPNPKRALRAHGVPLWGSSAPAHHTHPTAMQPVGGAHASSSSIYASAPSAVTCTAAGVGGREVHLCGAPSGLPLPWFCELKHLHMCSGGQEGRGHKDTVLAIQYTLLHW